MKIYICVKHVPDSAASIEITGPTEFDDSVTFILNPYDENAVEEAARMKERFPSAETVAVTVGKQRAEDALRAAMAMGADRGILIRTPKRPDHLVTARALAAAIKLDGPADLVFTGRLSIDSEGMQTMFRLAANLNLPIATNVVGFELKMGEAIVKRQVDSATREIIRMPLPCVIAAGKALNTPRYPRFPDIVKARKKPVQTFDLEDLDLGAPKGGVELVKLEPITDKRKAILLQGTAEESVKQLVEALTTVERVL